MKELCNLFVRKKNLKTHIYSRNLGPFCVFSAFCVLLDCFLANFLALLRRNKHPLICFTFADMSEKDLFTPSLNDNIQRLEFICINVKLLQIGAFIQIRYILAVLFTFIIYMYVPHSTYLCCISRPWCWKLARPAVKPVYSSRQPFPPKH